ncbi:helix-turn-helix domain-containing protein [Aestuariivivens sediminicola]|uniref:helix-turn-helix domain-containing protein n=1 Tax=Aestuariivivens sediminicola TaxID=2913560 RepID=UPI001F59FDF9|nr:helix-turn-helix domain-containing protein [Aestuariivivens sediminicola]
MNFNSKKNKTVIRAEKVAGKFTTISHRIIHDKRLSTEARLLLISILSDADSFDVSRTGLSKRLGLTEYKLDKALKELIKFGYIKKTKTHGQYFHYTISEYGNLNKEPENSVGLGKTKEVGFQEKKDGQISTPYKNTKQYQKDYEQLLNFVNAKFEYLNVELIEKSLPNIKSRNDVFEIMKVQEKEVKNNKLRYYNKLEDFVNSGYASKELKAKILKEVRRLIMDEHKKPTTEEVNKIRVKLSRDKYKNKIKKYGYDFETQDVDNYENPLD